MTVDMSPAKAGVICPDHHKVDITYENYMRQLSNPWAVWECPICGAHSEFDDARYEELNLLDEAP